MQSGLSSVGCGRDGNIGLSPFAVAEHNLIQPRHATDCYPLKAKRQAMRSRQKAGNGHLCYCLSRHDQRSLLAGCVNGSRP